MRLFLYILLRQTKIWDYKKKRLFLIINSKNMTINI